MRLLEAFKDKLLCY